MSVIAGTLTIQGTVTNTGGMIQALTGSDIQVSATTITAGVLNTAGSGKIFLLEFIHLI